MTPSTDLSFSDFGIFPSTTFGDMMQENKWSEPSNSSVDAPSRTTSVPSPATSVSTNPHTPVSQTQYSSFPFSPLISSPKDSYDSSGSVDRTESARLRSLLLMTTPKRTDILSDENNVTKNNHNILKGLLKPDEMASQSADDDSAHHSTPPSPANVQASHNTSNFNDAPLTPNNASTSNNNNNMLLKVCITNNSHTN